jgi:hypothetical protein
VSIIRARSIHFSSQRSRRVDLISSKFRHSSAASSRVSAIIKTPSPRRDSSHGTVLQHNTDPYPSSKQQSHCPVFFPSLERVEYPLDRFEVVFERQLALGTRQTYTETFCYQHKDHSRLVFPEPSHHSTLSVSIPSSVESYIAGKEKIEQKEKRGKHTTINKQRYRYPHQAQQLSNRPSISGIEVRLPKRV